MLHPCEPLSTTYRNNEELPADAPFRIGETVKHKDGVFTVDSLQFIRCEYAGIANYWRVSASNRTPQGVEKTVGVEGAARFFAKG